MTTSNQRQRRSRGLLAVALVAVTILAALVGFRVWRERATIELFNATGLEANDLVFSPDGQQLAVAYSDKTIVLWSIAERTPVHTFLGPEVRPRSYLDRCHIAFSPTGDLLAACDRTGHLWLWSARTSERLVEVDRSQEAPRERATTTGGIQFSSSGKLLVLQTNAATEVRRVTDGSLLSQARVACGGGCATFLGGREDRLRIVGAYDTKVDKRVDLTLVTATGEVEDRKEYADCHVFGYDPSSIVLTSSGGFLCGYPSGEELIPVSMLPCAISPDGELFAHPLEDDFGLNWCAGIELRILRGGALVTSYQRRGAAHSQGYPVAFSPVRDQIAMSWGEIITIASFRR